MGDGLVYIVVSSQGLYPTPGRVYEIFNVLYQIKVYKCELPSFLLNVQIFIHKLGIIIYDFLFPLCNLFFEDKYLLKRVTFPTSP